ncbi:GNAT family N-acetyltransferase [Tessaracoccus sp. OS52]|uniref:GNAT family N-acetyltransferase n=1 Tax=Tessaracoccus sp. OS52 TaxID=2886691 RepID=UPI001D106BE4|nr:GNAT family N-acetyltransferase [Tessaracoccus sp. OS52]MCC2592754.1 GNAT family N-acetyltransferase [Tessaracoccus sp. OS52]
MAVTLRQARPEEWEQARRLRLEMLGDAPHSFNDRLADAEGWDDARWRSRLSSAVLDDSVLFVAVDAAGDWQAQMGAREYLNHQPARVWLLEVYVSPAHRGTGVAAELLAAVERWAVTRGHARLYLDVHEDAEPARRFYRRAGFVETGTRRPYPNDPRKQELEMVKELSR